MAQLNENDINETFITTTPQKIRTSLATTKNTQTSITYLPPYNRAKTFVTIARQTEWCHYECCWCYKRNSIDSRCCGVCYACCPSKTVAKQCNFCPNDFKMYWDSGYVQTSTGYGVLDEKNGICCWFCFPIKFPLFFPCCLGSLGNECINYMRNTNLNYLF